MGRVILEGAVDDAGQDRRVQITALGRDEADAQLISRAWRYVAYRDTMPMLFPTRRQQVEYEAYVQLLARDAGVSAPRVVVAGATREVALLVAEIPAGDALADTDASRVTDAVLRHVWENVVTLHATRIAHGALDARHVVVGSDGRPVIVGFEAAAASAARGPMRARHRAAARRHHCGRGAPPRARGRPRRRRGRGARRRTPTDPGTRDDERHS